MIALTKKTIIYIGILLASNAVLIVVAFLIISRIDEQSKDIATQVATLDKRNLSTENLRDSLAKIKTTGSYIELFDQYLFPAGAELPLITDLENMAIRNKVTLKIGNSNLDNYTNNRLDIELYISGPLMHIMQYMSALESYKYIITINRIEFTPSGSLSQENSALINANMRLQISLYAKPTK